jgi:hypothetical protein
MTKLPWLLIPFDLSIPWFLDRRNPEVQAEVEAARKMPLTPAPKFEMVKRDMGAETKAFAEQLAAEKKTRTNNRIAKMKARLDTKSTWVPGSTWDQCRGRWIHPGEPTKPKPNTARQTQDLSTPRRVIKHRVTAKGSARAKKAWETRRAREAEAKRV